MSAARVFCYAGVDVLSAIKICRRPTVTVRAIMLPTSVYSSSVFLAIQGISETLVWKARNVSVAKKAITQTVHQTLAGAVHQDLLRKRRARRSVTTANLASSLTARRCQPPNAPPARRAPCLPKGTRFAPCVCPPHQKYRPSLLCPSINVLLLWISQARAGRTPT